MCLSTQSTVCVYVCADDAVIVLVLSLCTWYSVTMATSKVLCTASSSSGVNDQGDSLGQMVTVIFPQQVAALQGLHVGQHILIHQPW